ncbi:MAG: YvcK family protein [Candidatus Kerfeldbacteria bacterium]|nr:YvcK family protein [Candidatus Kerfeldbacteria bacterium]
MRKRIVTIGGGTGQPELLRGLREYDVDLTAIVTTIDNGGSSGRLREKYGILPPGDIRRCLAALSARPELVSEWEHRFSDGPNAGHTVGNLVLLEAFQKYGDVHEALQHIQERYQIRGNVLPVTLEQTNLIARLEDGSIVRGETNIDIPKHDPSLRIESVWLDPAATTTPQVRQAIADADMVVLSMGDLFTSLIPNLLVAGVTQAIAQSKARVVYICNRSTKPGETDHFTPQDFYATVERYLAPAKLDEMIVDDIANDNNPALVSGPKAAAVIMKLCNS